MKSGTIRQYSGAIAAGQRAIDVALIVGVQALVGLGYAKTLGYSKVWTSQDILLAVIAVVAYAIAGEANGAYRAWRGSTLRDELRVVLWSWFLTIPAVLLWLFATKTSEEHSRVATFAWFAVTAVGLILVRAVKSTVLRKFRAKGLNGRTAAIIGATPLAVKLRRELSDPAHGIRVKGIYDFRSAKRVKEVLGDEHLAGGFEQLLGQARAGKIDFVYITLPLKAESRIAETVAELADTTATVQLVTDFSAFDVLRARWVTVGGMPAVSLFDTPFNGASAVLKRVEDLVLGTLFLLIASPVMLACAIAIKATTKGPIFFAQTRYGLGGKPIRVLKFRTMTTADNGSKVVQAKKNDQRITAIGAILRRTSLDELPQFLNVIKGDMSIVGPRPHAVAHNEEFRSIIYGYMLRHKVKPGITGWAQVNGHRGETDTVDKMRARVEHDLHYIENWDLSWDLEIIFRTAFRVWADRNAY